MSCIPLLPFFFSSSSPSHIYRDIHRHQQTRIGDGRSLENYIEENREELFATAAVMRTVAKQRLQDASPSNCPHTNIEWFQWVEENQCEFKELLKTASAQRRPVNHRLTTLPGGLPEIERLAPKKNQIAKPLWYRSLLLCSRGWFSLATPESETPARVLMLFFAARCTYESWGFMLHPVSPQLFELQLDILKRDGIRSMLDIARDHDIDKNAILYHTPLRFVDFVEHRLRFSLDMEDCYSNLRRDINRH